MFPFDDITMEQVNNISHDYYFCDLPQEGYQLCEKWEINFKSRYFFCHQGKGLGRIIPLPIAPNYINDIWSYGLS